MKSQEVQQIQADAVHKMEDIIRSKLSCLKNNHIQPIQNQRIQIDSHHNQLDVTHFKNNQSKLRNKSQNNQYINTGQSHELTNTQNQFQNLGQGKGQLIDSQQVSMQLSPNKFNWQKQKKQKIQKYIDEASSKWVAEQAKKHNIELQIQRKHFQRAKYKGSLAQNQEHLNNCEFKLKVGDKADKIQQLIDKIDQSNQQMIGDIYSCREEFFTLENQKQTLKDDEVPGQEQLTILQSIAESGLDLTADIQLIQNEALEEITSIDSKNQQIAKSQKTKKNVMTNLLDKLHSFIEHNNMQISNLKNTIRKQQQTIAEVTFKLSQSRNNGSDFEFASIDKQQINKNQKAFQRRFTLKNNSIKDMDEQNINIIYQRLKTKFNFDFDDDQDHTQDPKPNKQTKNQLRQIKQHKKEVARINEEDSNQFQEQISKESYISESDQENQVKSVSLSKLSDNKKSNTKVQNNNHQNIQQNNQNIKQQKKDLKSIQIGDKESIESSDDKYDQSLQSKYTFSQSNISEIIELKSPTAAQSKQNINKLNKLNLKNNLQIEAPTIQEIQSIQQINEKDSHSNNEHIINPQIEGQEQSNDPNQQISLANVIKVEPNQLETDASRNVVEPLRRKSLFLQAKKLKQMTLPKRKESSNATLTTKPNILHNDLNIKLLRSMEPATKLSQADCYSSQQSSDNTFNLNQTSPKKGSQLKTKDRKLSQISKYDLINSIKDIITSEVNYSMEQDYDDEIATQLSHTKIVKKVIQIQILPSKNKHKNLSHNSKSSERGVSRTKSLNRKPKKKKSSSQLLRKLSSNNIIQEELEDSSISDNSKSRLDQSKLSMPTLTVKGAQTFLSTEQDRFNKKLIQVVRDQSQTNPQDFKLLALQNNQLISLFKKSIGQDVQFSFDDQQAMIKNQLIDFITSLNQNINKLLSMSDPDQSQSSYIPRKLSFSQVFKVQFDKKGGLSGFTIKPEYALVWFAQNDLELKSIASLIKTCCFLNRLVNFGHQINFELHEIITKKDQMGNDVQTQVSDADLDTRRYFFEEEVKTQIIRIQKAIAKDNFGVLKPVSTFDQIQNMDPYQLLNHKMNRVYLTSQDCVHDNSVSVEDFVVNILKQFSQQLELVDTSSTQKLILHRVIELSKQNLIFLTRQFNQDVQVQPQMQDRYTNTEKLYIYEGDQDQAKRGKQMLITDIQINQQFLKTMDLFDVFVSQTPQAEYKVMLRIKKVVDWLTQGQESSLSSSEFIMQEQEFQNQIMNTKHQQLANKFKAVNKQFQFYQRIIQQRDLILQEIENYIKKQQDLDIDLKLDSIDLWASNNKKHHQNQHLTINSIQKTLKSPSNRYKINNLQDVIQNQSKLDGISMPLISQNHNKLNIKGQQKQLGQLVNDGHNLKQAQTYLKQGNGMTDIVRHEDRTTLENSNGSSDLNLELLNYQSFSQTINSPAITQQKNIQINQIHPQSHKSPISTISIKNSPISKAINQPKTPLKPEFNHIRNSLDSKLINKDLGSPVHINQNLEQIQKIIKIREDQLNFRKSQDFAPMERRKKIGSQCITPQLMNSPIGHSIQKQIASRNVDTTTLNQLKTKNYGPIEIENNQTLDGTKTFNQVQMSSKQSKIMDASQMSKTNYNFFEHDQSKNSFSFPKKIKIGPDNSRESSIGFFKKKDQQPSFQNISYNRAKNLSELTKLNPQSPQI